MEHRRIAVRNAPVRRTYSATIRKWLYHLLPVVFWLLAIGGSVLTLLLSDNEAVQQQSGPTTEWSVSASGLIAGYLVSAIALLCIFIISRIKRHTTSVEECFQVALLRGIAAYWLPSICFLIIPIWGYLIYQNLFSFRAFMASIIGFATVAIWYAVLYFFTPYTLHFTLFYNLCAWIPTGAILLAWLASTVARNKLQIR